MIEKERCKVMDNKEKVLVDFAIKCIKGEVFNINSYAKEALEKLQPKVKLPKAAYEWMEEVDTTNDYYFSVKMIELFTSYGNNELRKTNVKLSDLITDLNLVSLLVDAFRYGYELLEETEEERIKREMLEHYKILLKSKDDVGITDHDIIDTLYDIAKG